MGLTAEQAATVIGTTRAEVCRLVLRGDLPRQPHHGSGLELSDVEAASLARWRAPGHPYWATASEAAEILGVSRSRVHPLVRADRIPAVNHAGRWFFRRAQLEVVANARDARRLGVTAG